MSDDLVKRLRHRVPEPGRPYKSDATVLVNPQGDEAADRIKALEAKLEKAVVALDKIKRIDNLVGVFAACERTLAEITEEQSHE